MLPKSLAEFIRQQTFSGTDLPLIHQYRGVAKRVGFAMQFCYFRFPKMVSGLERLPAVTVLKRLSAEALTQANYRWVLPRRY